MRRSIDDHPAGPADVPPGLEDDLAPVSWAVAISDDYDDAEPRVVLTVEEVGRAGEGLVTHLSPDIARRLRVALRDALREPVEAAESAGWDGDALEAQCFGVLAARVSRGLPLTFPGTTGAPRPLPGGRIARP